MAITIVKTETKISALVAAIAAKSGAYKETVSSALLSAVAHSIEHKEFSLITKLINEIKAANPRDLKVVGAFLQSVTPFKVVSEKEGRIETFKVLCRLEKDCEVDESKFKTVGEIEKAKKSAKEKAAKRDSQRCNAFARFVGTLKNEKGETESRGFIITDSEGNKTTFDYQLNIFAWFDDVNYFRNKGDDNGASGEKSFAETVVNPLVSLIKKFEAIETKTAQQKADLSALQEIAGRYMKEMDSEKADKVAAAAIAKDTKSLQEVKATESEIAAWLAHRAKRIAEGKTAENIAIEFKAHVKALKANKAAAEIATANDKAA